MPGWLTGVGKSVSSFLARKGAIGKAASRWRGAGLPSKAGQAVAETAGKAGAKLISWGTAVKVGFAGVIGWLFFTGGLPSLFSGATGLPLWMSQLIIAALIVYLVLALVRMIVGKARRAARPFGGGGYRGGRY